MINNDELLKIWKPIKHILRHDNINVDKLKRQLELYIFWGKNNCYGIIEGVTGFGKTFVLLIAIVRQNILNPSKTTIIVVPNEKLYNDWVGDTGYINNYKLKNIRVFIVNTYTKTGNYWVCDLLGLDEVHRYANQDSDFFSTVLDITRFKKCMGLSATLSNKEKIFLAKKGLKVVGTVTSDEARINNYISDYKIFNLGIELTGEYKEEEERISAIHDSAFKKLEYDFDIAMACATANDKYYFNRRLGLKMNGRDWKEWFAKKLGWDGRDITSYKSPVNIGKTASTWFWAMTNRKSFLHNVKEKAEITIDLINSFDKTIIVFAESTDFVDDVVDKLGNNIARAYHTNLKTHVYDQNNNLIGYSSDRKGKYIDLKGKYYTLDQLKSTFGKINRVSKDKIKVEAEELFSSGKIKALVTAKALDEGFDCPIIDMAIIASGKSTIRQNIQRIGRALRLNEDKESIIINLYVKNTQDRKWLDRRLSTISKSKIHEVSTIDEIKNILSNNEVISIV